MFRVVVDRLASLRGPQSTLDPAGHGAERIADLFWWMAGGGLVVWLAVIALAIYFARLRPEAHNERRARVLIIGGGVTLPTLILAGYLVYGLAMLPELVAPAPERSLTIAVTGEQWWWRVRYLPPDGPPVDLANEIRLPVGEPVEFRLQSADVIHAFWIPSLGGKIDMFPGRETRLVLRPTRTGVFRGVCAEYCGASHALMGFYVEVMEKEAFARWLARQAEPASEPADPVAARGREVLLANGCGACHTIRGTPADGVVGPDLTHVGSRMSLGAAVLPNQLDDFHRWVGATNRVKPEVNMPPFGMLPPDELRALSLYLKELK